MTSHSTKAAGLLDKASRLALAGEFDKAVATMHLALDEIKQGIFQQYSHTHGIEEQS